MWNYTEKVMDHFLRPRNVGEIEQPDAVGEVGNIVCGDALKLFLRIDRDKNTVMDAKFQTFGCASAIASASALTELIKGKSLAEVEKISNQDIAEFLGELPEEKMHCSVMGMEALQAALSNWRGESDGRVTAGDHGVDEAYDPDGLDRIICACFGVSERKIRSVVEANNLKTVEDVTHYTKAGGGCGGCLGKIAEILASIKTESAPEAENATGAAETSGGSMTNVRKMLLIQQALDNDIRPALIADGGDLELVDIVGDRVLVRLKGSCAGCPGAQITMKRWVEAKLREQVLPTLVVEEAS